MHNAAATFVPKEQVKEFLPFALPWLERTLSETAYTRWTLDGIVEDLQSGALQLWACTYEGKRMFLVTELIHELTGVTVHVVLGGGQFSPAMTRYLDLIEIWARSMGATGFVIWGRMGWSKFLRPLGFQFETAVFRRTFKERLN